MFNHERRTNCKSYHSTCKNNPLRKKRNSSDNVEQAREVESIDHALIDNQIGFSFESLYFQSKTSMEDDSFLTQGEYPHSCNSCSNQHLKSVIEEHLSNENLLECSSTPMKLIREEVTQPRRRNFKPSSSKCTLFTGKTRCLSHKF